MDIKKLMWGVRSGLYSLRAKIKLPGYIGKPLYISDISRLVFGKKVRIYPGLRAEIVSKSASIIVGEDTSIGQNCHIVAFSRPIVIGKRVTISGNVFISNCDHDYQQIGIHVLKQSVTESDTVIDDNCFIGYGAVILAGTKLGEQCIVGANSVVRGCFPDRCVIVGNPARIVKKYDSSTKKWVKV